jgi:hypothetical protein
MANNSDERKLMLSSTTKKRGGSGNGAALRAWNKKVAYAGRGVAGGVRAEAKKKIS